MGVLVHEFGKFEILLRLYGHDNALLAKPLGRFRGIEKMN
jgi:hypothetical protein